MIRFFMLSVLTFCLLFPRSVSAQQDAAEGVPPARFFSSMQDVPLVPGLSELNDQTVTFDKPEGRIIESVAEIESGDSETVKKAYEETLPQLGWTKISDNSYARDTEFLTLNFERYEGRNFVRVMVRPKDGIRN